MNSYQFRREIEIKRPKYLVKYKPLLEAISNKGTTTGGDYIKFGPFFQTYMYAFMIGYKRQECLPLSDTGEKTDFADISHWKPTEMVDYILMLILSESHDKIGFSWVELEAMDDEHSRLAVSKIINRIEGYANAGLDYIQSKYNNNKEEFRDPFVFVNLLNTCTQDKKY